MLAVLRRGQGLLTSCRPTGEPEPALRLWLLAVVVRRTRLGQPQYEPLRGGATPLDFSDALDPGGACCQQPTWEPNLFVLGRELCYLWSLRSDSARTLRLLNSYPSRRMPTDTRRRTGHLSRICPPRTPSRISILQDRTQKGQNLWFLAQEQTEYVGQNVRHATASQQYKDPKAETGHHEDSPPDRLVDGEARRIWCHG